MRTNHEAIEIGGRSLERTNKYRDVKRNGRAAIVIDDVLRPWRPHGIEIRGRAEAIGGSEPRIRLHPERIIGWGFAEDGRSRNARNV